MDRALPLAVTPIEPKEILSFFPIGAVFAIVQLGSPLSEDEAITDMPVKTQLDSSSCPCTSTPNRR